VVEREHRQVAEPLRCHVARLADLRAGFAAAAARWWPVLTTSACARHSGPTSERNGRAESSPSSKQTLATGFSGDSALSVIATTRTPR